MQIDNLETVSAKIAINCDANISNILWQRLIKLKSFDGIFHGDFVMTKNVFAEAAFAVQLMCKIKQKDIAAYRPNGNTQFSFTINFIFWKTESETFSTCCKTFD